MLDGEEVPLRPNIGIYTQPISFIGLPVVAVPVPRRRGLPIGVQIIAAPWREDVALRVAHRRSERAGVVPRRRRAEREWRSTFPRSSPRSRPRSRATRRRWSATTSPTLDALFWDDPRTIRYGVGENLYGSDADRGVPRGALAGRACARLVAHRDHHFWPRLSPPPRPCSIATARPARSAGRCRPGRASPGWRIVAAHVELRSTRDEPCPRIEIRFRRLATAYSRSIFPARRGSKT